MTATESARADVSLLVRLAVAELAGTPPTPQQACAAARAGARIEFFAERPSHPYWGLATMACMAEPSEGQRQEAADWRAVAEENEARARDRDVRSAGLSGRDADAQKMRAKYWMAEARRQRREADLLDPPPAGADGMSEDRDDPESMALTSRQLAAMDDEDARELDDPKLNEEVGNDRHEAKREAHALADSAARHRHRATGWDGRIDPRDANDYPLPDDFAEPMRMAEGDGHESPKARRAMRALDEVLDEPAPEDDDDPGAAEAIRRHMRAQRSQDRLHDDVERGMQNKEHPALRGFKGFAEPTEEERAEAARLRRDAGRRLRDHKDGRDAVNDMHRRHAGRAALRQPLSGEAERRGMWRRAAELDPPRGEAAGHAEGCARFGAEEDYRTLRDFARGAAGRRPDRADADTGNAPMVTHGGHSKEQVDQLHQAMEQRDAARMAHEVRAGLRRSGVRRQWAADYARQLESWGHGQPGDDAAFAEGDGLDSPKARRLQADDARRLEAAPEGSDAQLLALYALRRDQADIERGELAPSRRAHPALRRMGEDEQPEPYSLLADVAPYPSRKDARDAHNHARRQRGYRPQASPYEVPYPQDDPRDHEDLDEAGDFGPYDGTEAAEYAHARAQAERLRHLAGLGGAPRDARLLRRGAARHERMSKAGDYPPGYPEEGVPFAEGDDRPEDRAGVAWGDDFRANPVDYPEGWVQINQRRDLRDLGYDQKTIDNDYMPFAEGDPGEDHDADPMPAVPLDAESAEGERPHSPLFGRQNRVRRNAVGRIDGWQRDVWNDVAQAENRRRGLDRLDRPAEDMAEDDPEDRSGLVRRDAFLSPHDPHLLRRIMREAGHSDDEVREALMQRRAAAEHAYAEGGVDLFTVPPRREFLAGYAEEERYDRGSYRSEAGLPPRRPQRVSQARAEREAWEHELRAEREAHNIDIAADVLGDETGGAIGGLGTPQLGGGERLERSKAVIDAANVRRRHQQGQG
jgi:hypothetical protein